MKKRVYLLITVLIMTLVFSSCSSSRTSSDTPSIKEKSYTSMEEIRKFEGLSESVLGISPDGKQLITWDEQNIQVLDADSLDVQQSIPCERFIGGKKANWQGKSFIFSDASTFSQELIMMRSFNFNLYKTNSDEDTRMTNEKVDESIRDEGVIVYAPTWSADGKSILYCVAGSEGTKIKKVNVESGEKTTEVNISRERMTYFSGFELKDGLILCEYNGNKAGDYDIFLYDVKEGDSTSLEDVVEHTEDSPVIYDIKGWSNDRKTVLINKLVPLSQSNSSQVIQKSFVLTFDSGFKNYKVKTINYGLKSDDAAAYNPALIDKENGSNRVSFANILSPGGRYVISTEYVFEELNNQLVPSDLRELVLHDLETDKTYTLYKPEEEPELFGIPSPFTANNEAIYMTENGQLLVWFADGYRLFELKP